MERVLRILPIGLCAAALIAALAPYLVQGMEAHVTAHDHLDANFVWATVLAEQGQIFAAPDAQVEPILGGLERRFFGSAYQLYYWLFVLFPPFAALVVVEALTRLTAFVGAYALGLHLLGTAQRYGRGRLVCALAAMCFALLPFWPPGGATVAGVPLFLWAALVSRDSMPRGWRALGVCASIAVFVLYGSLVLSGAFALVFTTLFILRDAVARDWGKVMRMVLFNAFTSAAFLLQNASLIGAVSSDEATTREEIIARSFPFEHVLDLIQGSFLEGQYHADPGTAWPMFAAVGLAAVLGIGAAIKSRLGRGDAGLRAPLLALVLSVAGLAFTAVMHGIYRWDVMREMLAQTALSGFNFGRFHWLQPGLWAIAFVAALIVILRAVPYLTGRSHHRTASTSAAILAGCLALAQAWTSVAALPVYTPANGRNMPFNAFFAPEVFAQIRPALAGEADVRLGMVGLHPAIAQFNGFATLGGYLQLYPLKTKIAFREIIAGELAKDDALRRYYDDWGNRAYLFAAELARCKGGCFGSRAPDRITLAYDMDAFRAFGGTHIASVSEIANAGDLGLVKLGEFASADRSETLRLRIHLYDARGG